MLDEFLAHPDVVEASVLRSRVGFMAVHGGLEAMTAEIATACADRIGASLYTVVQPTELRWHVPSSLYGPEQSAPLAEFLDHVDLVLSLHGYGGVGEPPQRWLTVALGGARRDLAADLGARLSPQLRNYTFLADIDAIPIAYRGVHPKNPVNATRAGGVQLELPPRIRGVSPVWESTPRDERGFVPVTATLVETITAWAIDAPRVRSL